ncbi:DUF2270 domain-containing protein [Halobacterium jilantaiense]|uniref:Uncharacterized membrane protein n=1 Tax=Halobacterium jilantaiense TaxID=355548 RepID=A0A1I0MGM0_9EURY|nr:DUF2270 domain-containing protein [Halobacterium jilantaiense]SEV86910.1 Uncharacterized membrane protein [Halobacterium jilantaiense]
MTGDDHESAGDGDGETIADRVSGDRSAFTRATTGFYRGEVDRATTWRSRLDQTTNWAVVVVAAVLTWSFSSESRPHYVVLIGVLAVTAFLLMEANRYREYDVWRDRVRTVQTGLLAELFESAGASDDWTAHLADELRNPSFHMSYRHAVNHRLRRSYFALLSVLVVAWVARVTVYTADEPWRQSAAILFLPGELVAGAVGVFYLAVVVVTVWSVRGGRTQEFEV